ncbi:fibronectin type III domain-containing protein, partial [Pseudotenacibaculum sp. MALMAid0570]|uniref:fibronectin type III domain-containing protein n=1 Tax=Pseudotenacibaculum sp. MALMAid0570 TaxID=3143938 RepID=UPI0032DEDC24
SWGSTYQLSGTLANGDVFVIANSSAIAAITSVADVTTGSGIVTFNGNDAVALFKNGTLIDVIGDPNNTANFAQNTTLRRKSSVNSPNATYTVAEWDSYATDTSDGLGSHSLDGAADTQAPSAPSSLSASNINETTLDLSWNAATDNVAVTGYDVYQGASLLGTTAGTSYNVTGLTASTAYSFTVRAKDAAGNVSGDSNIANATTVDTTAPSAPTSLASANVTETTVDLSWSASSDNVAVTGYDVYQGATLLGNTAGTSYNVTGLTASTAYSFTVRAKDAAGNVSGDSNSVNITTDDPPTNTTTILSQSYFESGWDNWSDGGSDCARYSGSRSWEGSYSIRLRDNSGTASSMTSPTYDITSYDTVEVEFYFYVYSMENGEDFWLRYYDGSSWQTVQTWVRGSGIENNNFYSATVTLDSATYTFANNAQFRFQNDASGNADHIYIDQVTITGKTGVASRGPVSNQNLTLLRTLNTDLDTFILYPNPVDGNILNIELNDEENKPVKYRVVSLLGQVLKTGIVSDSSLRINQLKSGVYLLELFVDDEKLVKKFVKK